MKPQRWTLMAPLAIALAAAACATAPSTETSSAPAPTCAAIAIEIAKAEQDRHLAIEEGKAAYKAVIPVAVAAKFAKSKADAGAAEDRLKSLHAESERQGCARNS